MGRQPCCEKVGLKKGQWTAQEDRKLINFILTHGNCCWRAVPKLAGLLRCGKSCRLRWTNYLRPDLKRGLLSESEEKLVIELHSQLGNRWSKIASKLPGRTDNEIKNHWNTHIKKKLSIMGIDPLTHQPTKHHHHQQQQQEKSDPLADKQRDSTVQKNSHCPPMVVIQEEEEKSTVPSNSMEADAGFCIDEVPMIGPHEMVLVPCDSSTPNSSSSSSSSSSTSSSSLMGGGESMCYWGLDDFIDWDLPSDHCAAELPTLDPFLTQNQRFTMDEESWDQPELM